MSIALSEPMQVDEEHQAKRAKPEAQLVPQPGTVLSKSMSAILAIAEPKTKTTAQVIRDALVKDVDELIEAGREGTDEVAKQRASRGEGESTFSRSLLCFLRSGQVVK